MAGQVLTASAERHSEQFDQLLAEVASYNPDVDRDLLERAYRFASEAHEHQQRPARAEVEVDGLPGDTRGLSDLLEPDVRARVRLQQSARRVQDPLLRVGT